MSLLLNILLIFKVFACFVWNCIVIFGLSLRFGSLVIVFVLNVLKMHISLIRSSVGVPIRSIICSNIFLFFMDSCS